MTKELDRRFSDKTEGFLKYECQSLKKSCVDPHISSQIEFVRYNPHDRFEPTLDAMPGTERFPRSLLYLCLLPSYWRFSSLPVPEINQELDLDRICIDYNRYLGRMEPMSLQAHVSDGNTDI